MKSPSHRRIIIVLQFGLGYIFLKPKFHTGGMLWLSSYYTDLSALIIQVYFAISLLSFQATISGKNCPNWLWTFQFKNALKLFDSWSFFLRLNNQPLNLAQSSWHTHKNSPIFKMKCSQQFPFFFFSCKSLLQQRWTILRTYWERTQFWKLIRNFIFPSLRLLKNKKYLYIIQ